MQTSVDFSEICPREWGCTAWQSPTCCRDAANSQQRFGCFCSFSSGTGVPTGSPAHTRMRAACFTFAQHCCTSIYAQLFQRSNRFLHLKDRGRDLRLWIFLPLSHGCPKATIWAKGGVGSNGQKGQSPFQPDDVLAGAE